MEIGPAEQGAAIYVIGEVEKFDQKNDMFSRSFWDPKMLELGKKFYIEEVSPKNKPGYRLKDQALVNGSWHLENSYAQGVAGGKMGMYGWGEWDKIFEPNKNGLLKAFLDLP